MKRFNTIVIAACLFLVIASHRAHADVVVIVSAESTAPTLNTEQISRIFQGKSGLMTPVDIASPSRIRDEFYAKVIGIDYALVRAQWSRLIFTGKVAAPREFRSGAELVQAVAADPNVIGYVDRSFVNMTVKVVYAVK
jgi:ABC-type phosphate transport system substrate-binding protein